MQHHRARPGTAAPATVAAPLHSRCGECNVTAGVFSELEPLSTHTLSSGIFSLGTQVAGINLDTGPSASWVSQPASFSAPTAHFTSLQQCKVRQRNCFLLLAFH